MKLKNDFLKKLPKVLLHDHLDGGLRPETVIELAKDRGLSTIVADYWSFNVKARGFFAAQGFTAFNENVWLHLDQDR